MAGVRQDSMPRPRLAASGLCWIGVALGVWLLDRLTKCLALAALPLNGESVPVWPHVSLTLAFNRGASFSLLGSASVWQVWFLSLMAVMVSVAIVVILARLPASRRGLGIALALILGGALGNLCDRVLYAAVVDFLDLSLGRYHWPVFNVADSAICLGAVVILFEGVWRGKR